jgi:hypothetical protein
MRMRNYTATSLIHRCHFIPRPLWHVAEQVSETHVWAGIELVFRETRNYYLGKPPALPILTINSPAKRPCSPYNLAEYTAIFAAIFFDTILRYNNSVHCGIQLSYLGHALAFSSVH